MPTYPIDGSQKISLTGQMSLLPMPTVRGVARVPAEAPPSGVLGAGEPPSGPQDATPPPPTLELRIFTPAQPPVELVMEPPSRAAPTAPGVLGAPPVAEDTAELAMLEFQPDPGEQSAYALLHEIHTPDGIVYDITLPQSGVRGAILGATDEILPGILRFPVYRLVSGTLPPVAPTEPQPAMPDTGGVLGASLGSEAIKHVLHLIKAPIDYALRQTIAEFEGQGRVHMIDPDGTVGPPISSPEAWRARFDPAQDHRVLLFIHGFNSNTERSLPIQWLPVLAPHYAAILGYTHPTFSRDPLQNAVELLQEIPDDLRLNVDILAHSRGGLVARSLTELQSATPRFQVQRLITYGSPHAGTALAQPENWDRIISIGFTLISWITGLHRANSTPSFLPTGLELLLHAGAQLLFDLPGIQAMNPTSEFLQTLNNPGQLPPGLRYAAVSSDFDPGTMAEMSIREALIAMSAQVFFQVDNDLVVPTTSMTSIDLPGMPPVLLDTQVFQTSVDHFSYFNEETVRTFTDTMLTYDPLP